MWILIAALVLVAAGAVYALQLARQQQARAHALTRELQLRDEVLERFDGQTLPAVADAVRRADAATPAIDLPVGMDQSRFAQRLRQIADRYGYDLRLMQSETREATRREADEQIRQATAQAEETARAEVGLSSRQATAAAVRSFGTSVVSLGADVSQVVSAALREHRDNEVYETLTRIDHNVQQMIRQAQAYVVVCGGLPGRRWPQQQLTDVVGGAIGRVRDYLRVRPGQLDRVVVSRAVEPLVHTLATLLDNALRYSPPTSFVDIGFQEGHHGVTVIIDDAGVRMNAEQMEDARQILSGEVTVDVHQLGPSPRVGFPGIAALARRYGFAVYLDGPNAYGGMRAMVFVPESLLLAQREPAIEPIAAAVGVAAVPAPMTLVESGPVSLTHSGLPKRRRHAVSVESESPTPELALARPDIAAAWHSGSKSGRAAASDQIEGMDS
jgi:hypothetical protein